MSRFPQYGFKRLFFSLPSCLTVCIEHIYTSSVFIFVSALCLKDVSLYSFYRPEPLCSTSITEASLLLWAHPSLLFACWISLFAYINSPYWIGFSQLWRLTFPETPWPVISAGASDSLIRLFPIGCFSLSYVRNKVRPPEHSCKRLPASGSFSVCSLRFMLRLPSLIDHWVVPTSSLEEQSGRLLSSFHTARYRSVCRVYLLGWNG